MTNIRARQPYARRPAPLGPLKPFLDTEFANIQRAVPVPLVRAVFANDTVQASDDTIEVDSTAGAVTITLPPPDRLLFLRVTIIRVSGGTHSVRVVGAMSGASAFSLPVIGNSLTVQSDGDAWLVLFCSDAALVSIAEFGAVGNGVEEDSAAIQDAVDSGAQAFVPSWMSCRCDTPVILGANARLLVAGTLRRYALYSASTRPVVIMAGDWCMPMGWGLGTFASDNDSPDGVLLYGTENPGPTSPPLAIRWARARHLRLMCNGGATSKGLAIQSAEGYGVSSACYDGHFFDFTILSAADGVYLNSDANANTIKMFNFWDVRGNAVNIDGRSAGGTNITSGVGVDDVFVDGSISMNGAIVKARHANTSTFTNVRGEPGSATAKLWDVDDTNFHCDLDGTDNCIAGSVIPAPGLGNGNTVLLNGKVYADDFVGPTSGDYTGAGTVSAPNATFTTLFNMGALAPGAYIASQWIAVSANVAFQVSAVVTWDGSAGTLTKWSTGASADMQKSGDAIQGKQSSGSTANISYAYLRIGPQ